MGTKDFYLGLAEQLKKHNEVTVTTILEGDDKGCKYFLSEGVEDKQGTANQYRETLHGRNTVVILGGGHVSLALEAVLKQLDYLITVVDDREEFANKERFQDADQVFCMDFDAFFEQQSPGKQAYYIIVTRGHKDDYRCLNHVLKSGYDYVGMIGSRSKVGHTFKLLRQEGYSEEVIKEVHSPIGLPIGGDTPEEIAISIAAEMIAHKNKKERNIFPNEWSEILTNSKEPLAIATVIEKAGSAPRGKGSRMMVTKSGKIYGSIGGGAVEHAVIGEVGKACDMPQFTVYEYDLSNKQAAGLGMICGGAIKVMVEWLL